VLLISCQVTFAYPTNLQQPALNNVTFFFPAGETTFVVGTSGSGKSTLGNLLMKYYDPSRGELLIDGHSIQTLDPDWLRQNVTLVQQQNVLFNETVFQNIAFGRQSDVTEQDVLNASKTADLRRTIKGLPEGLATMVGSNGKSLSGGQQQRIAIARARLRDSPIVILDEATSALDQASRQIVMKAIREWRKGKSTIIISHDVSQIRDEEYVYVMENGRVVQEGWRKELAEKAHGTFASFVANSEPTDQSATTLEQRRESGPLIPTSAASEYSEEKTPPHWNYHDYVSSFFGMHETPSDSLARSLSVRGNKRMTLGLGAAHANELRAKDLWSNNPALAAEDQSEASKPAYFRQPLIPFVSQQTDFQAASQPWSPTSPSCVHFSASQAISHHHSSLNEVTRPRSRPPAIDTSLDTLRAAIQLSPRPRKLSSGHTIPKTTKETKPETLANIFQTIWPTLDWRDRTWLMLGFFSAFVVAISTPAFAYIFSKLLTVYTLDSNRTAAALKWGLALLAVASVDGTANYWTHYALECSGQAWVNALRVKALKRILAQPKHWFEKKTNSPDRLNECLDRNAEEMRNLVGRFAGPIFTTVCMMTVSIVWSFIISWELTLVAIGCGSIAYLATWSFDLISSKWEGKCDKAAQHTSSIFTETFSNIRVVRALTLENHFIRKHNDAVSETFKIGLSRAAYSGLMYGVSDAMSYFITATIFYYGTTIITEGELKVSSVLEVVNLLLFGIANCMVMVAMVPQLNSSRITATQMLHLANLPGQTSHETLGTKRLATPFPIMFNNLSFTYPGRTNNTTLSNITLTINAGTCTAIVGGSGCGKSTIAAMLVGFYSPDPIPRYHAPSLTFGGTSILDCKISSLRNLIALVPQTPQLFPSSILANITYGLPEASPFTTLNSVMMAAQDAGIHDFIMSLPLGYQSVIGDGGLGLSGGQAQRIAIARALVRRPKVLILDEATSALDAVSAEAVRETVRKLMARGRDGMEGDMAVVIISHSVEMMRVADRIVVIEGGRVVEEGTYGFDELRRRDGPFARLVGRQDWNSEVEKAEERAMTPVKGRNRQSWGRRTSTSS
jgi:ATP-binding cassette subfamily B (MDR/TAP) protein 1